MKAIAIALLASFTASAAFGAGAEAIIKQRAKELSNQNNVRQGVAPPTQQPQTPGAPATPPAPQPTALNRLQSSLAAIKLNTQVTPDQKAAISRNLIASAQGSRKPSVASANKLADDLAAALAEKSLPETDRTRLLQDLNAILNGPGLPSAQVQAISDDVQAIFQKNGLQRNKAVVLGADVKAISAEIQPAPAATAK